MYCLMVRLLIQQKDKKVKNILRKPPNQYQGWGFFLFVMVFDIWVKKYGGRANGYTRLLWEQDIAGSNPVPYTKKKF